MISKRLPKLFAEAWHRDAYLYDPNTWWVVEGQEFKVIFGFTEN